MAAKPAGRIEGGDLGPVDAWIFHVTCLLARLRRAPSASAAAPCTPAGERGRVQ